MFVNPPPPCLSLCLARVQDAKYCLQAMKAMKAMKAWCMLLLQSFPIPPSPFQGPSVVHVKRFGLGTNLFGGKALLK